MADSIFPEVPHVDRALAAINELNKIPRCDLEWQMKKLKGYRDALFLHYAPFRAGDRIVLDKDYYIDPVEQRGWCGYERMMVRGAMATVKSVDWYQNKDGSGGFTIAIVFDNEFHDFSWKRVSGEAPIQTHEVKPEDRHAFSYYKPERWWRITTATEPAPMPSPPVNDNIQLGEA